MSKHQLVDISLLDPSIILDIRYATAKNFLGFPVYPAPKCYLHREVAQAVSLIQEDLQERDLFLKIFDGYRPLPVQQLMWDTIQDERFVANPAVNRGKHTRGTAVDVTLVDMEGNELEMPSGFDEFTERAYPSYMGASAQAIRNRALLKEAMEARGFIQLPREWWHFDFIGWDDDERFPPLALTFEQIESDTK